MHFFVKLSPSFVCLYVLHWQSVYHSKTQGREYRNCIVFISYGGGLSGF